MKHKILKGVFILVFIIFDQNLFAKIVTFHLSIPTGRIESTYTQTVDGIKMNIFNTNSIYWHDHDGIQVIGTTSGKTITKFLISFSKDITLASYNISYARSFIGNETMRLSNNTKSSLVTNFSIGNHNFIKPFRVLANSPITVTNTNINSSYGQFRDIVVFTPDPEPANHPTNFIATSNSTSQITTTWTDDTGAVGPSGYLIMCNKTGTFTDPVDTVAQMDDANCSDGSGVQNIVQGVGKATWTGLDSGTQYFYKIFPYSNSGTDINYKINGTVGVANTMTNSYYISITKTADGAEDTTNTVFTVTVTPTNTTGLAITGNIVYTGTATNGTDYTAGATKFSIPNGSSTTTITLTTTADTLVEGTETITSTISSPSVGSLTMATTTANLLDNINYSSAIAKIQAYANNGKIAPTLQDYANTKVIGVTMSNLFAINVKVDTLTSIGVDTTAKIQALVDAVNAKITALAKIKAYATSNTNPVPTVQDYIDTEVTGVSSTNLSAVNAKVDATNSVGVDSTVKIQALVDAVNAKITALAKIKAYATSNTNPVPTVQDYIDTEVTGVSSTNLSAVNAKVDATNSVGVDSTVKIQALVDIVNTALTKIQAYASSNANLAPTLQDYVDAGVTDVSSTNLSAVNAKVDATNSVGVDSTVKIQALVDIVNTALTKIQAYATSNQNPAPTVQDYIDAGVTGVTTANLFALNAKVNATDATGVNTTAKIQALVDNLNSITVNINSTSTITTVIKNNGNNITITVPTNGSIVTVKQPTNGTVVNGVYTPATGFSGSDDFKVKVDDGKGGVSTKNVLVVRDDKTKSLTNASSNIDGTKVTKDDNTSESTLSADRNITGTGFVYRGIAIIDKAGKTKTRIVKVNLATGEQTLLELTLKSTSAYEAGNQVIISIVSGMLQVEITTAINEPITIN